jgi:OOP family OmpA-OmpF porin
MPGCTIFQCEIKDFDAAELQTAPASNEVHKTRLEGKKEWLSYECSGNLSALQLVRNAENALRKAGFTIVYSGLSDSDNPLVTARKGSEWVEVEGGSSNGYYVTTMRVKEMEQRMEATADAIEAGINASGRFAVYGINFDTGKATLRPESEKILSEIQSVLKKNSGWKICIEGHTDNVGSKTSNQRLSEARAATVVDWLVRNGIEKLRLTAQGFGDSRPVADNSTEEGRAKNRRVELVKM